MKKTNIYSRPLAFNICGQMLREMERVPAWTMAHVLMNPKADSLLHEHHLMQEAYIITRGSGQLIVGGSTLSVQAGDAVWIPIYTRHKLVNTGAASLEHLVLATPPFDPKDVFIINETPTPCKPPPVPFLQPEPVDCFDGAKIIAYQFGDTVSVAFGWVSNDRKKRKNAHYHKKTSEWIFVAEGEGDLELNGRDHEIKVGDWIGVEPGEFHALRNYSDQHLVVACICNPCFNMDDVHYSR